MKNKALNVAFAGRPDIRYAFWPNNFRRQRSARVRLRAHGAQGTRQRLQEGVRRTTAAVSLVDAGTDLHRANALEGPPHPSARRERLQLSLRTDQNIGDRAPKHESLRRRHS